MTLATCPACGAPASGNFCSACGAGLIPRTCSGCATVLSSQARFCHRCGRPAAVTWRSHRTAWIVATGLCVLLVGGIVYRVTGAAPRPVAPDMANPGLVTGSPGSGGPAPDISRMTPRERFDRLFNRIMQAAERGDSAEVGRFTPMALGAYAQLDSVDVDGRYHAAVLRLQAGDFAGARALADTILAESPGHLFGYVVRGTSARLQNDQRTLQRARQDFLTHYEDAMRSNRVEYLEHRPVVEEFKRDAETRNDVNSEQ